MSSGRGTRWKDVIKKWSFAGNAPIPKGTPLAMGLPTMIEMMINALYNLVDAYFVWEVWDKSDGAISVAFPLGRSRGRIGETLFAEQRGILYINLVTRGQGLRTEG